MNRIYRFIFNPRYGQVATHLESARRGHRTLTSTRTERSRAYAVALAPVALAAGLALHSAPGNADSSDANNNTTGAGAVTPTGSNNTEYGYSAGLGTSGSDNTANGAFSGQYVVGDGNTALGLGAGSGTASNPLTATNTTALGHDAISSGTNSVAIGANSSDGGQSNAVSVGNTTQQRQIINVAPGTVSSTSTDAVNGSQLYHVQSTANQALSLNQSNNSRITANSQNIQKNTVQIKAIVNGQAGVCTVNGSALQCSVIGQTPAHAEGQGAVAMGVGAQANGTGAIAIGQAAQAVFAGTLALGNGAQILPGSDDNKTTGSIAIGMGAQANADPSVALGLNALAGGANSTAVGAGAYAVGHNATAVGFDASAVAENSVAVGAGSAAQRPYAVSVGNASQNLTRQITNVAPGTALTDAVNLGQLQAANQRTLDKANAFAARGVAAALAMPTLMPTAPGKTALGANIASYAGYGAIGIDFAHRLQYHNVAFNAGVSLPTDGSRVAVRFGVSTEW